MSLRSVLSTSVYFAALFLSGCGNRVHQKDLIGTYKAEMSWGNSIITLSEPGVMHETVQVRDGGGIQEVSGIWKKGKADDILIIPFIEFDQGGQIRRVDGISLVPQYDAFRKVYLETNANDGTAYYKH
jgi:hypothetical protein